MKIKGIDLEMLIGAAIGWTEEQTEDFINDDGDWDVVVYEHFNVEVEEFEKIASALIKLTPILKSPLTESEHHAFVRQVDGGFMAIAKIEP